MTLRLHVAGLLMLAVILGAGTQAYAQRRPAAAAPAVPPAPGPDIQVRSWFSQTAAWVGDPIDYIIDIDAAPGIDVVDDDFAQDKLTVEGLDLESATGSRATRSDGRNHVRWVYRVVPFDTALRQPRRIGELTVRYRSSLSASSALGVVPAGEIKVPAAALMLRSTLPDDGSADGARDLALAIPPPLWLSWLRPAGIALVVVAAAPLFVWLLTRSRTPRVTRQKVSSRARLAHAKGLIGELEALDPSTPAGRLSVYERIDQGVRDQLALAHGVPARSLTARELRNRLADLLPTARIGELCDVLTDCEVARYGPGDRLPDVAHARDAVTQVASVLRNRTA